MNSRLLHFLIALCLSCTFTMCASPNMQRADTSAQTANPGTDPAEDTTPSLLYRITGNGLDKPSYLFGTIHIICPADFFMPAYVEQAVNEAEVTVLELDMDEDNFMMQMQQSMINPGMVNFTEQMEESSRKRLDAFLKRQFGAGVDQLGIMKPFVLENMLMLKYLPCETPESYEARFIQLSQQQEQEVIGLETVAYQFSIFDSIPQDVQIEWIEEMLTDSMASVNEFGRLVETYKSQDVERLFALTMEEEQFAEYADLMLFQRNANWTPKIEQIIDSRSAFIAVGAGHLGGEKGVINLLRKQGYNVEPVTE